MRYSAEHEKNIYDISFKSFADVFSDKLPLHEAFIKIASENSESCAITEGGRTIIFKEFLLEVSRRALYLDQYGILAGDKIILLLPNSAEFYFWYHALHGVGAVVILVSLALHDQEILHILSQAQPVGVVFSTTEVAARFNFERMSFVSIQVDQIIFEKGFCEFNARNQRKLSDPAVILYTSGSTGRPRGVVLSAKNILVNALQNHARFLILGLKRERFLVILPLTHSFGHMTCLWMPLISASSVHIVSQISRNEIKKVIDTWRPTFFFGVPAFFLLLLSIARLNLEFVKFFVSGGDFLSVAVQEFFMSVFGRHICSGYGLSEASPVVGLNIHPGKTDANIIDPFLVGIKYKIVFDNDLSDTVGELLISSETTFLGYFSGDLDRLESPIVDGWLSTGDLVKKNELGQIQLVGRKKDIIIFKGFNIYPEEIERVLMMNINVFKVVAVGIEHQTYGQIPIVAIQLQQGAQFDHSEYLNLCKSNLASYKIPHKFVLMESLPLNSLGKVDKKTVKKMVL
jgi:long-chain acyl-CoA synthetase